MVLTFPHLGNLYIPVKALLDDIGVRYVIPSFDTRSALETGALHVPEYACLPLKITIGNISEAYSRGADTVLMVGGRGPCRFGYYCEMQRQIIGSMGMDMEFITLDNPTEGLKAFYMGIRKLIGSYPLTSLPGLLKKTIVMIVMADEIESMAFGKRAAEVKKGETDALYRYFRNRAPDIRGTARMIVFLKEIRSRMERIETVRRHPGKEPLKVGIIGEIYTTIETSSSFDVEPLLGRMGIVIERTVTLSSWVLGNMLKNMSSVKADKCYKDEAKRYIGHGVGGHAEESVGNYVIYSKKGYDGVIHIFPMGCMPEIVARSILSSAGKDFGIPVLHLVIDEMTGEAGVMTRLEAFVDLMCKRRQAGFGKVLLPGH